MENRRQKKIFIILSFLIACVTSINAQIDTRTQNQIKAKFLTAQDLYDSKDYSESFEKIAEIETLTNGQLLAAAQNLKVKCLVGQKQYIKAKKELYILEGLKLSNDILKDVSSYSSKIENFVKAEEQKNKIILNKIYEILDPESIKNIKTAKMYVGALVGLLINDKLGYINNKMEIVIPFEYDGDTHNRLDITQDDYIATKLNDKWGLIDRNNNIIIDHKYQLVIWYKNVGLCEITNNDKVGFLNLKGDLVIPLIYEQSWGFSYDDGLAPTKKNGKWGCINKEGLAIIPFKYDDMGIHFNDGVIDVILNGKKGKIDTKGNIVEPFK